MRATRLKSVLQLRSRLMGKMRVLRETVEAVNAMHDMQGSQDDILHVLFCYADNLLQATGVSVCVLSGADIIRCLSRDWPESIPESLLHQHLEKGQLTQFVHKDKAVLISPLEHFGKGEAIVAISRSFASPWRTIDKWVYSSLIHSASAALKRISMLGSSRRQADTLELLNQIGRTFASSLSLEDLFESIYQEVSKIMATDSFFVALYDDTLKQIELRYLRDEGKLLDPITLPLNDGPTARAIKEKTPQRYSMDSSKIPGVTLVGDQSKTIMSALVVPILLQGDVIGALSAQGFSPDSHDNEDILILSTIANQAAIAIDNATLYGQTLEMALTDSMTGLKNGRAFHVALDEAMLDSQKNGESLSLIMIDSDSLKSINDRFGHLAGDEHICRMARIIEENVRPQDIIARYAGDEFMVILPDTHLNEAKLIAERIVRTVRVAAYQGAGGTVHVTASAGVAEYPKDANDSEDLIRAADRAMYTAKRMCKNRTVATDEMPIPAC